MSDKEQEFNIEDMEYLRHGDEALLLSLYRPNGDGPFPLIVDLHGGAWNTGDRAGCAIRAGVLAKAGFAVAALDFRQGPDRYPSSLQDINYAIRWLKSRAERLKLDPNRVGLSGQSSGGHLAALSAMRPNDERYAALPLEPASRVDAKVSCLAIQWPVINPYSRYHHALKSLEQPDTAGWVKRIAEFHETYWVDEDAMIEGNPMLILERGEQIETPPALWLQGTPDIVHDYRDPTSEQSINEPERFQQNYRAAGGIHDVVRVPFEAREQSDAFELLVPFFNKHLTP